MPCDSVARRPFSAADVGPHFRQAGELWWFLAVMNSSHDDGQRIGVQFSVFRKDTTGACADSADNLVVSTAAIAHGGGFHQATRLFPTLKHARLQSQPFALDFDDGQWGITSASNSSASPTQQQRLVVASGLALDGTRLSLNLSLMAPSASVLMADRGFGDLNGTLLAHISKPLQPATGTVTFGGRSAALPVHGDFWLQHIWFSTPHGAAFPQWNWFNVQFHNGWNFQMVALGNGTSTTVQELGDGACLGDVGSYGNLVEPKSGRVRRLSVGVGADVCYRVLRRWTDPRCPHIHYPVVSSISIRPAVPGAGGVAQPAGGSSWSTWPREVEMVVSALQYDNVVRPPLPRWSGYCAKAYYEGASDVKGNFDGEPVGGVGFIEHEW